MKIRIRLAAFVAFVVLAAHLGAAQEITIAAAADLQFVMSDLAAHFEKQTGQSVKVIYGSSGNFYQQIQNGAPFDIFFSANLGFPEKLQAAGLIDPASLHSYARGRIVLWVPNDSKLDLSPGLAALLNPDVKKIAIANPQHAPYGQAAVAAMQKEGIYDQIKSRLVLGENISQTATFVMTGAADVGVIALSLAISPNMKEKGRYSEIPAADYPPIQQACAILASSKHKDIAQQFLAYVRSPEAAGILRRYGFDVPQR